MKCLNVIVYAAISIVFAGCSHGSASSVPTVQTAQSVGISQNVQFAAAQPLAGVTAASMTLAAEALSVAPLVPATRLQYGGIRGTTVYGHSSGSTWQFGEDVGLLFAKPITPNDYYVKISPDPEAGAKVIVPVQADNPLNSSRNLLQIRWNKSPGKTYSLTVYRYGSSSAVASLVVRAPANVPAPETPRASRASDQYYYGSLEHSATYPAGIKLPRSGEIDSRALRYLTAQRVHFIRFGPGPSEVAAHETGAQSRQHYSFASTDPAIETLHQNHINVLYVIDAAPAPRWGNRNAVGDGRPIFETPALYAEYCKGVAEHIKSTLPWITRVEIGTNEPNYSWNWENRQAAADGMAQYADTTGAGFAHYARACYAAIKAVARELEVVAPGITVGSNAYPAFSFMDNMYANGCRTKLCWDILGIHSFSWTDPGYTYDQEFIDSVFGAGKGPGSLMSYRGLQQRAMRDGDSFLPPVMITEMGYSSFAADARGVDPNVQAYFTSEAFNRYLADSSVRGVVYADIVNHEPSGILSGVSTLNAAEAPKPVWNTFREFASY